MKSSFANLSNSLLSDPCPFGEFRNRHTVLAHHGDYLRPRHFGRGNRCVSLWKSCPCQAAHHFHVETKISYPVALTTAVWADYVAVPDGVEGQDEVGRLWDILWMLRAEIRRRPSGSVIRFVVLVRNDEREPQTVTLKSVCGPGDNAEPVITVMLPDED